VVGGDGCSHACWTDATPAGSRASRSSTLLSGAKYMRNHGRRH
jgi:hypothetical protein